MLEITKIVKDYVLKDQKVDALKGVSICFRRSEFVAVLGPSGCGKTTLLNLIGGLDRYTSGDLIIDGVSTKHYKDKDWDNYRNHRVGFVFQTYNLIPHQTILENVELALTLSGIKRAERRARAIEVLNKVGLSDKLKSKPNQLSGGQMQRVAIARALVNDPEIILADEPTGALDSKTSVQIMELLKEVSRDRLVIMVTHNPELANTYANRIVRLFDGELIEDSAPYSHSACVKDIEKFKKKREKEEQKQQEKQEKEKKFKKREKKTSMSFFTALSLSFKNLLSKKGRTILVAIAGSIGIIGIALVVAVSSGMTSYINTMQSESLASYPVSVLYMAVDTNSVLSAVTGGIGTDETSEDDSITLYDPSTKLMSLAAYNYITPEFISYVNDYYSNSNKRALLNDYQINYAADMRLITYNENYSSTIYGPYVPINSTQTTSALSGSISSTFFQGLDKDYVLSIYDMVGTDAYYPTKANEVALVLNSDSTSVYTLYGLGLEADTTATTLAYDDVIGTTYRLLYNDAYYEIVDDSIQAKVNFNLINSTETLSDFLTTYLKEDDYGNSLAKTLYEDENGIDLKITCILMLKDDATGSIFSDGIMYTSALADSYRENSKTSEVVQHIYSVYGDFDESGNFVFDDSMATVAFDLDYKVNASELETYFSTYADLFTFSSPGTMQYTLREYFNTDIELEEVLEIYLQVYNASDIPIGVSFYATSFDAKDDIIAMIDAWNAKDGVYQIVYSDTSAMLLSMLNSIVNVISYVLIAFAAISLVVSSIMISIITYTSVIERTKEIGVLRSVGASKGDVSNVFNAETIIIGLLAGIIGVAVSGLLTIPISLVLKSFTGIASLVSLNFLPCLILVLISVALTFIAGLVPARIAAKKDPVIALRSE